jgi:small-conductance mechanosensitive channel
MNIFDITIIKFSEGFRITVLNIMIFVLIWYLAKLARKYAKDIVHYFFKTESIRVAGKELETLSIVRQILTVIAVIIGIESLSLNNEAAGFTELLKYDLIRIDQFHISIYNIFLVAIFIFAARIISSSLKILMLRAVNKDDKADVGKAYTVAAMLQYLVYTVFIVLIIQSLGVDITILIASSAALFVGLGLGLQKIFADFVSGIILLFEGTIKVGDIVEVDNLTAKVVQINIRTSRVKTLNGNYLVIPNSKLTSENINNWSFNKRSTRHGISVNIAYGTDTDVVRETLYDCALKHHMVDKKRPILVFFEDFGEYSLQFQLYFWTAQPWEVLKIKSDIRFLIDKAFREKNIRIPIPQQEIRIHSPVIAPQSTVNEDFKN